LAQGSSVGWTTFQAIRQQRPSSNRFFMTACNPNSIGLSLLETLYAALSRCVFGPSLAAAYAVGASAEELRARIGRLPAAGSGPVWLHGASAGEMAAGARLLTALRRHGYHLPAIFTASNRAGVSYISRWGAPDVTVALAPWDVPAWVRRAFDRWRPSALFLIETELWPLLVFEAHRRRVPVLSLSGRIYPRDVSRYRAIRAFIAPTLRRLNRILVQNEIERERFIALGAYPERCVVAGNLKCLREEGSGGDPERLRNQLGIATGEPMIVFGSVHQQELALIFEAIAALRLRNERFIIAPRHLSSVRTILHEAAALGLASAMRSRTQSGEKWRVLVLDSMGELGEFYALATIAVIGGGFKKFGGHNPFEALEAGAPVLFGPHFEHFEDEARSLVAVTPEALVASAAQLSARMRDWLEDEASRKRALSSQQFTIPDADAVTRRYLGELSPFLGAAV
jgi:3-deoxy-D-manno-octulosonic-acid transferase